MPDDSSAQLTLYDAFLLSYKQYKTQPACIYRAGGEEFTVSYEKLFADVLLLAKAFRDYNMVKGSKVFLLSDNRYSWLVTDLALISLGAVSIPRGSDTPAQEVEYILDHSQADFLIVETSSLAVQHADLIASRALKGIFVIDDDQRQFLPPTILTYSQILSDRNISPHDVRTVLSQGRDLRPNDLVTIIYTSGTTGLPKGVMLTHANIMHNVVHLPSLIAVSSNDRWLSILPSWHIFERTAEYIALAHGCCLVYSSVRTFAADLATYRPTVVATVPRVWEALYTKVNSTLKKSSPRQARLFSYLVNIAAAFRRNRRILRKQLPRFSRPNPLADLGRRGWAGIQMVLLALPYLVARKKLSLVQEKFGGRLRLAISGGGSLPAYLDEWIDAVGIRIVNAYGMTECSPGIAGRGLDCHVFGTIGPPFPLTQIRIADDNDREVPPGREGEIQIKGPQVFGGYFQNPEANAKAFTPDGYFRSGDLGRRTLSGELVITGRAKEIIVLSSGENIDPTNIEATITRFPFVQDAVLVGQDKKGLGALIVPDVEKMREFVAEKMDQPDPDPEQILQDRQILERVKKEINKLLNTRTGFKSYEKLQSIHFLSQDFKLGEELTNTFKKKRHVIEQKYKDIINRLLK
ncbi:AMP-dependent synthetase/ligase [Desulfovermiculus halophilus]|jgi:long-chain acyl-CoA synthetase|uniref:AMP-dependent synthetase/ligase n=1 Tax=Desulfovermiculus halophilus TaxID=339722 RepID=UPI0004829FD6|nr:AMP-binding protein [Desulfovermiculus halophilus]